MTNEPDKTSEKKKGNEGLIILIIIAALLIFGWFGVRPYLMKKHCYNEAYVSLKPSGPGLYSFAKYFTVEFQESQEREYQECIRKYGL